MEKIKDGAVNASVMGDMIEARLPHMLKFTPFAHIDTALVGVPGDVKTVPAWNFVGAAEDVGEGVEIEAKRLTASSASFTVKKAMQSVTVTEECINSGLGDPIGQAEAQLARAIALKVDADVLAAALSAPQIYDGSASQLSYAGIVDAVAALDEEEITEKALFVNPAQVTALRKDPDFLSADKYQSGVALTGEIGMIAGVRLVPSRQIARVEWESDPEGDVSVIEDSGAESANAKHISAIAAHCPNAISVGDKVKAVAPYYRCPLVKLESADEGGEVAGELSAITIFMKKDTSVDAEWYPKKQTHDITAAKYYGVALTNAAKVVVAKFGA